jgi:nitronate monooxygenase
MPPRASAAFTKLVVHGLEKLAAFYGEAYGLHAVKRVRGERIGDEEIDEIMLSPDPNASFGSLVLLKYLGRGPSPSGELILGFTTDDLPALLERVRATGARIISSATTVAEARWLEERGVDAIIAMGLEAGGHRGNFLSDDMGRQVGTFALVPQIVDAVKVPVIAAGGIADARGIVAAFALGASAVQIGTAYMLTPEAKLTDSHRQALRSATDDGTRITNLFTGRPARGIVNRVMRDLGAINPAAPSFPLAAGALLPLKTKAEQAGSGDFTNLWSGQAARLARELPAGELTRRLAAETLAKLSTA